MEGRRIMGKRLPYTPRSQVRSAIRKLFLRSRERAAALKRDKYTCQTCGRKKSTAKGREFAVEVHHRQGIGNWDEAINAIYYHILCDPSGLETQCPECHDKKGEGG